MHGFSLGGRRNCLNLMWSLRLIEKENRFTRQVFRRFRKQDMWEFNLCTKHMQAFSIKLGCTYDSALSSAQSHLHTSNRV